MSDDTKPKRKPELKVVFDSNVLYTGTASDLVNQPVAQIISESCRHQDITFFWYLPEIVVLERTYQMIQRGLELLPNVQKLEQLLGHNLNITAEIIESRVKETVQKQLTQLSFRVENLAVDKVDWNRVIHNSAFRKAPFNPGEKEKGFRDAVLAETFLQIVKDSPTTPRICRIALISADNLLSSSVLERTSTATNIRILKSLDELKSLINTLVSSVSEEVIGKIREQAELHFFAPKDEKTLYYTEKVGRSIQEKFGKELDEIPEGADRRENGSWFISAPGFLKKEGQRVTWVSSIEVEAKAFKYEKQSIISGGLFTPSGVLPISPRQTGGILGQISQPVLQGTTVGTLSGMGTTHWTIPAENLIREKMIAEGRTHFEVTWSHLLSTNLKFRSSRIDNTRFVKTTWEPK